MSPIPQSLFITGREVQCSFWIFAIRLSFRADKKKYEVVREDLHAVVRRTLTYAKPMFPQVILVPFVVTWIKKGIKSFVDQLWISPVRINYTRLWQMQDILSFEQLGSRQRNSRHRTFPISFFSRVTAYCNKPDKISPALAF